ncbi:MAG: Crp/Fnr family transcriptional regulator [Anaerovoracaceae bacterium]|jgi:CRP-like cAMP-binding protein
MIEFNHILKRNPLFKEISEKDIPILLNCLSAQSVNYEKNQNIFLVDEKPTKVGIILTGSVQIVKEDIWGNRLILAKLSSGGIFGEAFSCANIEKLPVSVFSCEKSKILMIDYRKIITTCPSSCSFHTKIIQNMLQILANKNIMLTQKIEHLTKRTTREKLLSYLSSQALYFRNNSFYIPFNRQELADYLSVDRSAMSKELCKMRDEGILDFQRNFFKLFTI